MKIFIIGSKRKEQDEQEKERFNKAGIELGKAIARAGHTAILCSQSENTIDPYIIQGILNEEGTHSVIFLIPETEAKERSEYLDDLYKKSNGQLKLERIQQKGWRIVHLLAAKEADVIIAIGGSVYKEDSSNRKKISEESGTLAMIYTAEILEKPIILLPFLGGAAKEAWDYIAGRYYKNVNIDHLQNYIQESDTEWGNKIIEMINRLKRNNPFKKINPKSMIFTVLVGIVSLIGWLYLFFASPDIELLPRELILCLLWGLASIFGSMFRIILQNVGAVEPEWKPSHSIISVVIGSFIGFVLFILVQITNLVLNGNSLSVTDPDDFNRVSLTLSFLLLLASLFPEVTWRHWSKKSMEYLEKELK